MTRNAILTRDSSHLRFRKEIVGSISLHCSIHPPRWSGNEDDCRIGFAVLARNIHRSMFPNSVNIIRFSLIFTRAYTVQELLTCTLMG
jgi:hypothetical protein